MNKSHLLHEIANSGYNAGFGAKKSFASFDILSKAPNLIGWGLTSLGALGLVFDSLSTKTISATTLCIGFITTYLGYASKYLKKLETSGVELTKIRNELGILYGRVKAAEEPISEDFIVQLGSLQTRSSDAAVSNQVMFSGWLAHLKFFGEAQIQWIDNELHFGWWKDKVPASFKVAVGLILIAGVIFRLFFVCPGETGAAKTSPPPVPKTSSSQDVPLPPKP